VLVLAALLLAGVAAAEDGSEDELLRWVPGLAFSYDMLQHKARGAITTSNVLGPPLGLGGCSVLTAFPPPPHFVPNGTLCPNSEFPVTSSTSGGDTDIASLVNASLELATPRLIDRLLSPRLFAHADAAIAFGFERNLAGERKPGLFFLDTPLSNTHTEFSEGEVAGQGSRAKMQIRSLVVSGGAGVAFTATVFERKIRLKPSLEYLTEEVDLIASVRRAVKQVDPAKSFTDFRLIDLHASSTERLHGVGGRLELEIDAGRLGPVMMSIFVNGGAYHFLGNLHHTFFRQNEFGENATWNFDLDPWTYRAGVGARFKWLPETL
jgi:hypothetical protein